MLLPFARMLQGLSRNPWQTPVGPAPTTLRIPRQLAEAGADAAHHSEATSLKLWIYRPSGPPRGLVVISPGLHFQGPADPRFDVFARSLAQGGLRVVAPFIPDYLALELRPQALRDFETVCRWACSRGRPLIFSISFGSALALASAAALGPQVDGVLTFGGFGDLRQTLAFCAGSHKGRPHDPLNLPALYLNLVPWLFAGLSPEDRRLLKAAYRHTTWRTWGNASLKQGLARAPICQSIAKDLPAPLRVPYLEGVGLAQPPTGYHWERVAEALTASGDHFQYLAPEAHLARLRCPVVVAHGKSDDVIPWEQAELLHKKSRPHTQTKLLLSDAVSHTSAGETGLDGLKEQLTMLEMAAHTFMAGRWHRAKH